MIGLGHSVDMFNFSRNHFPKQLYHFQWHQQCISGPVPLYLCQYLILSFFKILPTQCIVESHCGFNVHFYDE